MAKIPEKFMGLIGKFVDSLDYNDLPKGWADNWAGDKVKGLLRYFGWGE